MATNPYTTDVLLASMKRRGLIPTAQNTFTDADLLAIADEELQTFIVPFLVSLSGEYLVDTQDTPVVVGRSSYPISPDAIGGKLRELLVLKDGQYRPISRIEPERVNECSDGYVIRGNDVVLLPSPTTTTTIRMRYYKRPSRLVALADVRRIIDATQAGGSNFLVELESAAPASWAEVAASWNYFQLVHFDPGFESWPVYITSGLPGPTNVVVQFENPDDFEELYGLGTNFGLFDQYLCLRNESPIPQIPVELHPVLTQRVAFKVWEALGKADKALMLKGVADEMLKRSITILSPRVENASRPVINHRGPGWRRR